MTGANGHPGSKIAEITLAFWVMKIAATTLGETGGDLLSMTLKVGYGASTLILLSVFLVTLGLQLSARRFHPLLYWLVILTTSTAGTTLSDYMDRTLGLGYASGAMVLLTALAAVLIVWRLTEGTIAVRSVDSVRAEGFYWAAILVSNTLGTALGDFLADSSGLGFLAGAVLIASTIGLVALAWRFTRISPTALFWAAFVLTRPLGATMGDLLTKGPEKGGLGFGTVGSSAVLAAILAATILSTYRRRAGAPAT